MPKNHKDLTTTDQKPEQEAWSAPVPKKEKVPLRPVSIDVTEEDEPAYELPASFLAGAEDFKSGLPPSPRWETPGEYLEGRYLTTRDGVGPNRQKTYILEVPAPGATTRQVTVWGTTQLDGQMALAAPTPGDHVIIIFDGVKQTERNQNPVKLFRVLIKRQRR